MATPAVSHLAHQWRNGLCVAAICGLILAPYNAAKAQLQPRLTEIAFVDQNPVDPGLLPSPGTPVIPPPAEGVTSEAEQGEPTASELADILARLEALEASVNKSGEKAPTEEPAAEKN